MKNSASSYGEYVKDEVFLAGELQETSKKNVLKFVHNAEQLAEFDKKGMIWITKIKK